jgi:hypothetical protein
MKSDRSVMAAFTGGTARKKGRATALTGAGLDLCHPL